MMQPSTAGIQQVVSVSHNGVAQKPEKRGELVNSRQADYHAYLLRLWREGTQLSWRAELVSPHTGAKQHFANQGQLLSFLAELTATDETASELANNDVENQSPTRRIPCAAEGLRD